MDLNLQNIIDFLNGSQTVAQFPWTNLQLKQIYDLLQSGPGGGGITGVSPIGNIPKTATTSPGDVIVTLDASAITDLPGGLYILKNAETAQYINFYTANTVDPIISNLELQSDSDFLTYHSFLYTGSNSTKSGVFNTESGAQIKHFDVIGNVPYSQIDLDIDGARIYSSSQINFNTLSYPDGLINVIDGSGAGIVEIGDNNTNYLRIETVTGDFKFLGNGLVSSEMPLSLPEIQDNNKQLAINLAGSLRELRDVAGVNVTIDFSTLYNDSISSVTMTPGGGGGLTTLDTYQGLSSGQYTQAQLNTIAIKYFNLN